MKQYLPVEFITTDDRILKYRDDRIKIMSPIQFITEEV
jgi:hypothetical protein